MTTVFDESDMDSNTRFPLSRDGKHRSAHAAERTAFRLEQGDMKRVLKKKGGLLLRLE